MLEHLNFDTACNLVARFQAREAGSTELDYTDASNPVDDESIAVLDDQPLTGSPEGELRRALEDLGPDQRIELFALALLGREAAETWPEAWQLARQDRDQLDAEIFLDQPMLGSLVNEGLAAIGLHCKEQ